MINNMNKLATQPEIIRYMHMVAGFPMKATWIKAIWKENYTTWPGLMVEMVTKNFPKSEKRIKGHNRKIKAGLRSTKVKRSKNGKPEEDKEENSTKAKRKETFIKLVDLEEELHNKIFTDKTGTFPYRSSQGIRYVMVVLECKTNYIMVEA